MLTRDFEITVKYRVEAKDEAMMAEEIERNRTLIRTGREPYAHTSGWVSCEPIRISSADLGLPMPYAMQTHWVND